MQLIWKVASFQQLADDNDFPELDAAVSAFALHHLAAEEKRRLYQALHAKLRDGGWFIACSFNANATSRQHCAAMASESISATAPAALMVTEAR